MQEQISYLLQLKDCRVLELQKIPGHYTDKIFISHMFVQYLVYLKYYQNYQLVRLMRLRNIRVKNIIVTRNITQNTGVSLFIKLEIPVASWLRGIKSKWEEQEVPLSMQQRWVTTSLLGKFTPCTMCFPHNPPLGSCDLFSFFQGVSVTRSMCTCDFLPAYTQVTRMASIKFTQNQLQNVIVILQINIKL